MESAAVSSSATLRPDVRINAGTATSSESYFGVHDSTSHARGGWILTAPHRQDGLGAEDDEEPGMAKPWEHEVRYQGPRTNRAYVYYVARPSPAPFCAPSAESGSGQNNVTARAVTRGCEKRKTGCPSPFWGVIHRISYPAPSGPPVVAPERRMTMPHALSPRSPRQ